MEITFQKNKFYCKYHNYFIHTKHKLSRCLNRCLFINIKRKLKGYQPLREMFPNCCQYLEIRGE